MCLIVFAYKIDPVYPLVLVANRDEFLERPTHQAHWWENHPRLLAGKDLLGGGTWLGMTDFGSFSALTNVRDQLGPATPSQSRGLLPLKFLSTTVDEQNFSHYLRQEKDKFQGYNLLYGAVENLHHYSNRTDQPLKLSPGLYGLSNASLDTPWPKVMTAKSHLQQLLTEQNLEAESLLKVLDPSSSYPDESLPRTGVPLSWERLLSAIRIVSPEYGTRSSTILKVDCHGWVELAEKNRAPLEGPVEKFHFQL